MSSSRDGSGGRVLAVCRCPECPYESPTVEAGPDIGCGACPECGSRRLERDTLEVAP